MPDPRRNPMSIDPKLALAEARKALGLQSESAFQAQVKELAQLFRWEVYHTHNSQFSDAGFPDLVCVRDGVMVALELKTDKGKTTAAQDVWIRELDKVPGVTARVARPADFDEVKDLLR